MLLLHSCACFSIAHIEVVLCHLFAYLGSSPSARSLSSCHYHVKLWCRLQKGGGLSRQMAVLCRSTAYRWHSTRVIASTALKVMRIFLGQVPPVGRTLWVSMFWPIDVHLGHPARPAPEPALARPNNLAGRAGPQPGFQIYIQSTPKKNCIQKTCNRIENQNFRTNRKQGTKISKRSSLYNLQVMIQIIDLFALDLCDQVLAASLKTFLGKTPPCEKP